MPSLLSWSGWANYGHRPNGITELNVIYGSKNPEKIPTHVAASLRLAARYIDDAEYTTRFIAALHDTGLNETDRGALKGSPLGTPTLIFVDLHLAAWK